MAAVSGGGGGQSDGKQRRRRRGWRYLGSSATKSPSKILLEYLDPGDEPMYCYRRYIRSTVSFNVANRSISMLTPELLSKFYLEGDVFADPKYFSLFKEICLSKLENVLNKRIILLMVGPDDTFVKAHDKRVYDRFQQRQPRGDSETLYFVLERCGRNWHLYELCSELSRKSYVQILTENAFFDPKTLRVAREGDCLLQAVCGVLGRGALPPGHVHGRHCSSLRELVFCGDKDKLCDEVGTEFILASHIRCSIVARNCRRKDPKHNLFGIHAVFGKTKMCADLSAMPVVCVTHDQRFYLLNDEHADGLRKVQQRSRHQQREAFPGHAGGAFDRLKKKVAGKTAAAAAAGTVPAESQTCPCRGCRNKGKYARNMMQSGPQKPYTTDLSTFDLFRLLGKWSPKVEEDLLKVCRLSIASYDVESIAVPIDDLMGNEDMNVKTSTMSSIRMPRQVQSVHEPVRIGFTDQLRQENGLPSLIFRPDQDDHNAMVGGFVEAIFEHRDAAATVKYGILSEYFSFLDEYKRAHFQFFVSQKMLPADYCSKWQDFGGGAPADAAAAAAAAARDAPGGGRLGGEEDDDDNEGYDSEDSEFERFLHDLARNAGNDDDDDDDDDEGEEEEAVDAEEDDDDDAVAGVCRAAIDETLGEGAHVALEAALAMQKKREARRISDIEQAWSWSIFGILERRLTHLAHCYNVYGFNSSSFDLVILCSRLIVYAKETGRRDVTIQREGTRIPWMRIQGVKLCEIKKLCSPGASLSSLGESCNLAVKKQLFPHKVNTHASFLDRATLPRDAKDWASDLNPAHSPSQAEVDEVLALYEEKGFQTIGQFLEYYLDLDCDILQKSAVAMHQRYYDILGLSYIDSRKSSVSSFSSCGAQTFLARHRRPAQYFANHCRLYSLIRESLRGGLNTTCRTVSGSQADISNYVDLLRGQMEHGAPDGSGGPDLDLCDRVKRSGLTLEEYVTHCNAHLLPPGMAMAALYTLCLDINRCVVLVLGRSRERHNEYLPLFFPIFSLYANTGKHSDYNFYVAGGVGGVGVGVGGGNGGGSSGGGDEGGARERRGTRRPRPSSSAVFVGPPPC